MSVASLNLPYYEGVPLTHYINVDWVKELVDFPLASDDLFIATYMKSGTTWTQQIVSLIQTRGEDISKHIFQSVSWFEMLGKDAVMVSLDSKTGSSSCELSLIV